MSETRNIAPWRPGAPPPSSQVNLLKSILRHLWLSLFLWVVLGAAGGYLAFKFDTVSFTSTAEIHVARNFQRMLQTDREMELRNTQEYDIFRNEQIGLIMRPDVLEEGLRRADQLDNGVWADPELGPKGAVARFGKALDIYLIRDAYRIAVDLTGTNPDILQPGLEGLLAAFLDAHRLEFSFEKDERPQILRQSLAEVDKAIHEKRKDLQVLAEELNVLDFKETRSNPWVTPLENSRIALVEAQRDAKSLRLQLKTVDSEATSKAQLNMVMLGGAESVGEGLGQIVGPLVERRSEAMSRLISMNPGHVARAGLEQEVKLLESQIASLLDRHIQAKLVTQESDLQRAEMHMEQLAQEVEDLGLIARTFVSSFQRGVVIEAALEEDLKRRAQLRARLNFFETETKSPSYVRIVQGATVVDPLGESNLVRNLILAVFLAAVVAFGLPLLKDLTDQRVHTTQDVEAVFGFPPAIWIPEPKKGAQAHLALEQIRRFALALDRDQSPERSRLIQFTEVKTGKGAQDVVGEIAKALASFGRKILVVDAAVPRQTRLATDSQTAGFLGLMAGRGLEIIPKEGWDFLEYGNPLVDKGKVISGWDEILRDATHAYDMVLIRADPLLGSPDAEQMASSVDLVVLMVEAERLTRGEIKRAGDVLASLHPAAVGTLLHNAKIFRNHGYYRELLKERKALPPVS
jgi:hypothetical protein